MKLQYWILRNHRAEVKNICGAITPTEKGLHVKLLVGMMFTQMDVGNVFGNCSFEVVHWCQPEHGLFDEFIILGWGL